MLPLGEVRVGYRIGAALDHRELVVQWRVVAVDRRTRFVDRPRVDREDVSPHRIGIDVAVVGHVGRDLVHRPQQLARRDLGLGAVGTGLRAHHLHEQAAARREIRSAGSEESGPIGVSCVREQRTRFARCLAEVEAVGNDHGGLLPEPMGGGERHADVHAGRRSGGPEERRRRRARHDRGAGEAQVAVGGSCEIVEQLVPVVGRQVVVDGDDRPVAIVGAHRRDGGAHRGHRVPAGGRPVVGDHEGRTLGEAAPRRRSR